MTEHFPDINIINKIEDILKSTNYTHAQCLTTLDGVKCKLIVDKELEDSGFYETASKLLK